LTHPHIFGGDPISQQEQRDGRFLGRAFAQRHYELSAEQGNAFSERGGAGGRDDFTDGCSNGIG